MCHYPNGSQNNVNHFIRVGSPSSYVEVSANISLTDIIFERGLVEVLTSTIGIGLMNSLWFQCLSLSYPSYSPTLRVTLASKLTMFYAVQKILKLKN